MANPMLINMSDTTTQVESIEHLRRRLTSNQNKSLPKLPNNAAANHHPKSSPRDIKISRLEQLKSSAIKSIKPLDSIPDYINLANSYKEKYDLCLANKQYQEAYIYYQRANHIAQKKIPHMSEYRESIYNNQSGPLGLKFKQLVTSLAEQKLASLESEILLAAAEKDAIPKGVKPSASRGDAITVDSVDRYMRDGNEKILFIDLRPRESFISKRFPSSNIVCIDPSILLSIQPQTDIELEQILSNTIPLEKDLFLKRGDFDLIIYYDDESTFTTNYMKILINCIYTNAFSRKLKEKPVLLYGGLNKWEAIMGSGSVWKTKRQSFTTSKVMNIGNSNYSKDPVQYFRNPEFGTSSEYKLTSSKAAERPQSVSPVLNFSMPVKPQVETVLTGLENLGNTCYMNCIIQCLVGTWKLRDMFVKGTYKIQKDSKLGYKGLLAHTFAKLMKQMTAAPKGSYIRPREMKEVMGHINSVFKNYDQQDCEEFLETILFGLHEDLNARGNQPNLPPLTDSEEKWKETQSIGDISAFEWNRYLHNNSSPMVPLLQGQYMSTLQCRTCGFRSITCTSFSSISLPIPQTKSEVRIEDCFDLFSKTEILGGEDSWKCPKCNKFRESLKAIHFSQYLPEYLVVHLKRFKNSGLKLNTMVKYNNILDLSPFGVTKSKYKLYAITNHFGVLVGGHYTAYVESNDSWTLFDDTHVKRDIPIREVYQNKNAYVLFYKLMS